MTLEDLMEEAKRARDYSYAPYSGFCVGAALLTKQGKVYSGCNIENAAYTPGNCAERTAFFKAVSAGEKAFEAIAVAGGPKDGKVGFCPPCGVCRQVMMEFCDPDAFKIILLSDNGGVELFYLKDMLPMGFGPDNLRRGENDEKI